MLGGIADAQLVTDGIGGGNGAEKQYACEGGYRSDHGGRQFMLRCFMITDFAGFFGGPSWRLHLQPPIGYWRISRMLPGMPMPSVQR
jgi:hypothetical protein